MMRDKVHENVILYIEGQGRKIWARSGGRLRGKNNYRGRIRSRGIWIETASEEKPAESKMERQLGMRWQTLNGSTEKR